MHRREAPRGIALDDDPLDLDPDAPASSLACPDHVVARVEGLPLVQGELGQGQERERLRLVGRQSPARGLASVRQRALVGLELARGTSLQE